MNVSIPIKTYETVVGARVFAPVPAERLYEAVLDVRGFPAWAPGVRRVIELLLDRGLGALVLGPDSIEGRLIDRALQASGLARFFRATVSSEEVERGKPAPDVYLETAGKLGVEPSRCAAVEDHRAGREGGQRAHRCASDLPVFLRQPDRIEPSAVVILRVLHGAQRWPGD
jgi:beta-phosphoglucomutase-like phosphatase (HAD superfamily)